MSTVPQMMRVPVFLGEGRIEFEDRPVPVPGKGELLVQVKANALCGSEREQYSRGSIVIPGHETAGTVVSCGDGTSTPLGTQGVVYLMEFCGSCRNCRQGYTNQCLQKRGDYGFTKDGGYEPFELVNERVFFPIDARLDLSVATLLLDVVGTTRHAIGRAQVMRNDIESILIAGSGPIGLGLAAVASISYGNDVPILVSDYSSERLRLAELLGGRAVDLKNGSPSDTMKQMGIDRVDAAFDTSGREAGRRQCLDSLSKRGVLVCVGHGERLSLDVSNDLIANERSVLGSEYFRFADLKENLKFLASHLERLQPIITHRYGIDHIRDAFDTFWKGNSGKVVVEQ